MAKVKLTGKIVADAKPLPDKDVMIWDTVQEGFYLRIRATGRKNYGVQMQVAGKQQRLNLGLATPTTLDEARKLAAAKRVDAVKGIDPVAEKRAAKLADAKIVKAVIDAYEADMKARNCAAHHVSNTIATLRRCLSTVASRDVASLTRQECVDLINRVPTAGARQAFRTRFAPLLNYATNAGLCDANVLAGWRQPRTSRADMTAKAGRALTPQELKAVWYASASAGAFGRAVRVMMLTGLRRGEALALERGWMDAEKGAIVIPGSRMKNGKPHAVPVTPALKAVLDACPQWGSSPLFFPARGKAKGSVVMMQGLSKLLPKLLKASGTKGWSLHDLRRSYRSMLSDLGLDHDLAERMIAHSRDRLTETYDKSSRWPERVAAAEAIERRIMQIVSGEAEAANNIIPLHVKAADTAA